MAEKVLSSRIIHKHDVAANWSKATNFVPKQGELIVYDIDADYAYERIKIGDGTKNVNALPFVDDALRASLLTEIGAADDKVDAVSALVGDTAVSEQINAAVDTKMDKENPTGTGAFSLNRKEGTTVGTNSHTEGTNNTASGVSSHAEGDSVVSSGNNSHAEGSATKAIGAASHAEGLNTTASGGNAHAEGSGTQATNINAHAEGQYSKATGQASHAEGFFTNAIGVYSHSEGYYTSANSSHQHVQGKYNVIDSNATYAHVVGNGTSDSARSNAHTLDWDGNAWFQGTVKIGGASQDNETAKELATQEYVDTAIATIPAPDVSGQINEHNTSETAHSDIRTSISDLSELVGDTSVSEQIAAANMIHVGPTEPTDPNIQVWINTAEEGTGIVPVLPRIATIALAVGSWTGSASPYSQAVEIATVTSATKIDLQPTVAQVVSLQNDDIALMAQNDNGVVTIYSFGGKPSSDMTMQVMLTEVSYV